MSRRYQYSNKIHDAIIVVEGIDILWEDFLLDVAKANKEFSPRPQVAPPLFTPSVAVVPTASAVCNVCGGKCEIKSGVSKAGKSYKIMKCLAYPELVAKQGHSYFF